LKNEKDGKLGVIVVCATSLVAVVAGILAIKEYMERHPKYQVSGAWVIENTIDQTSYRPYKGLKLLYHVHFTQRAGEIVGTGEKWAENGQDLPAGAHSPISIRGWIGDSTIRATFTEKGTKRETSGAFVWSKTADPRRWVGTFTSTAANSSGASFLVKIDVSNTVNQDATGRVLANVDRYRQGFDTAGWARRSGYPVGAHSP
jgi:hypothetical protein